MERSFTDTNTPEESDKRLLNSISMTSPDSQQLPSVPTSRAGHEDHHHKSPPFYYSKKFVKLLVSLTVILAVLLVAFIALYLHTNAKNAPSSSSKSFTKDQIQIAAKMLEIMDDTINPCENFYQYACGGWLKDTEVPDSKMRFSNFENLVDKNFETLKHILNQLRDNKRNATIPALAKAAIYYQTCMDTPTREAVGDKPVKKMIKDLGSWPVTDPDFDGKTWNLMKSFVNIQKNASEAPLFNLYVSEDIKNSHENIIVFDQSGLNLNKETYLGNSPFNKKQRKAYLKMMKSIVTLLGANETSAAYMDEVLKFETELAKITMSVQEQRDYRQNYQRMTLKEFANKTAIPDEWLMEFVNSMFEEGGQQIDLTEEVVCFNTEYIKKAYKLFMDLTPEVQASYIMWHAVNAMTNALLGKYEDVVNEYANTVYGIVQRPLKYKICVGSTINAFGYALAIPFVEDVYDTTAKAMSIEIIHAIKDVFENNLDDIDWMDNKTKSYAKLKASKMLENIGYPEFILNDTAVEMQYSGFIVEDGQHFINFMAQRKYGNIKNYQKRGKPYDKSKWTILPTTVNAYYSPTINKIAIPAGILQWPFYDKRAPRAVAYGAIGMVVGHEITHGFDDQGKHFTIEGNLDTWWTEYSANEFIKRSQCFIEQYSNFTAFNEQMNGEQTLGENLADNGGMRQSLQAYRNWVAVNGEEEKLPGLDLTPDQLYFLAFGQVWCTVYRESATIHLSERSVHSLSHIRVIGTLQNSEEFSEAFQCPLGSRMNPKRKCRIW